MYEYSGRCRCWWWWSCSRSCRSWVKWSESVDIEKRDFKRVDGDAFTNKKRWKGRYDTDIYLYLSISIDIYTEVCRCTTCRPSVFPLVGDFVVDGVFGCFFLFLERERFAPHSDEDRASAERGREGKWNGSRNKKEKLRKGEKEGVMQKGLITSTFSVTEKAASDGCIALAPS